MLTKIISLLATSWSRKLRRPRSWAHRISAWQRRTHLRMCYMREWVGIRVRRRQKRESFVFTSLLFSFLQNQMFSQEA